MTNSNEQNLFEKNPRNVTEETISFNSLVKEVHAKLLNAIKNKVSYTEREDYSVSLDREEGGEGEATLQQITRIKNTDQAQIRDSAVVTNALERVAKISLSGRVPDSILDSLINAGMLNTLGKEALLAELEMEKEIHQEELSKIFAQQPKKPLSVNSLEKERVKKPETTPASEVQNDVLSATDHYEQGMQFLQKMNALKNTQQIAKADTAREQAHHHFLKAKALKKKELQALQNKKLAEKQAQLAELEKEQKAEEALRKNPDVVNISETHTVYGKDYETNAISPKSFEIVSIPEHDVEPLNEYGEDGSYEELLDTEEALLTELPDDASDEQVDNLYAKTESLTRAKVLPFLNAVEQDVVDAEKRNTSLSESLAAATGFIEKNTEYVAEESLEEVPAPKAPNLESKEMSREEKKKEILNLLSQPKKPVETPEQLVAQKKKEILDLISSRSKT